MSDERVGLNAQAVFAPDGTPAVIFKDSGNAPPSKDQIRKWHEAAWNCGVAPLLWIITPTEVSLYDCYASSAAGAAGEAASPLDRFALDAEDRLRALDAMCGRLATETGAFWSSPIGKRIDRRHRVDRELLAEINALEEHLTSLPPASASIEVDLEREPQAARDFAQRLIGRCIFTWYLLDRGIAQRFLPHSLKPDLSTILSGERTAYQLFDWLRETFNGDLFPMDDPGAERQRLGERHLAYLQEFVSGRSLVAGRVGQGRLFRFRFDAIPIDLISAIYQQFARSSAAKDAHFQGLHYTPIELVHFTLDPVFERLPATARVVDPTCGSGAFLVEAFRRLVWKNSTERPAGRDLVREILYTRLFGLDINRAALGIAAFSLYLAALELDGEPVIDVGDLKFDRLIGTTLFEADTLGEELPQAVTALPFDAVVGNPPWTFSGGQKKPPRESENKAQPRPRRSPDQAFLQVAAELAGDTGRVGMVMKASPFFSSDEHAIDSRNTLLKRLSPAAVVNLSALRKEGLFPDATGPALVFLGRCALAGRDGQLIAGSVPWTADFARNGLFHVGPGELRAVPLERVVRAPAVLKAAAFGTLRDCWLLERLAKEFPTLDALLTNAGLTIRGQGFKVKGKARRPAPPGYFKFQVLTPKHYQPFRVARGSLLPFVHTELERSRDEAIFAGPLLICPKGSLTSAAEIGRYGAAVYTDDLLYTESFYGVSFAGRSAEWAYLLSGILNSSVTTFQLALGGSTWGLERPTVEPTDLLSLRMPDLANAEPAALKRVLRAEREAAKNPGDLRALGALDGAVSKLYGLERDEALLTAESVERARMLLAEGRAQRSAFLLPPRGEAFTAYAAAVGGVLDGYLRAKGERHLEATIYLRPFLCPDWSIDSLGMAAVRFSMVAGAPGGAPIVNTSDSGELAYLAGLLRDRLKASLPPYLYERRQVRVYHGVDLIVVKPNEGRYWTGTAGLNDADMILADDRLGMRNGPVARA